MKELAVMLGALAPKEMLLDMLKQTIQEYEANPTDENFRHIGAIGLVIASREATKNAGGPEEFLKQLSDMEKADTAFGMYKKPN